MNGYESFGLGRKRGNTILIGTESIFELFTLADHSHDRDANTCPINPARKIGQRFCLCVQEYYE